MAALWDGLLSAADVCHLRNGFSWTATPPVGLPKPPNWFYVAVKLKGTSVR